MQPGVYAQLVSVGVQQILGRLDPQAWQSALEQLDAAEKAGLLADHFARALRHVLQATHEDAGDADTDNSVLLHNTLLRELQRIAPQHSDDLVAHHLQPPARQLRLVWPLDAQPPASPDSPLTAGTLLTGTRLDPSLVSQLRKELETADQVDILCSFIKWGGIRILKGDLERFTSRAGTTLRVITTSYMGATDLKAVELLRSLPQAQVRISYDTHRTRLHAKAYIIHRRTGFGSAYIGSANLSNPALTDGLEWTVKISQHEQAYLWEKVIATFETYWNDAEFEGYEAADGPRLKAALEQERGGSGATEDQPALFFDLRPYAFQQEILDRLEAERDIQGRRRHLVVAATGTGKTMIAAFDYRRWARTAAPAGRRPRLLFVAHRQEILKQSLASFRAVLRDQNFGDLLVGGAEPPQRDHLFASIQSYNSRELFRLPPDHFDYIVVDEFHHACATTYRILLDHVRPKVLLGLTATPERGDGLDIRGWFDGHFSAEIRLADAINRKLLCPFQYFGVSDSEDLSGLRWSRGGYRIDELEARYTGNDIRARLIIEKTAEKVLDIRLCRGLGFCVSVAHADFMARRFRDAGVPAEALSSDSTPEHRRTVQERLLRREINFIFVVDLYNEGVDIPELDTVLLLRPTESLTVYLQQLGRGLRLCEGKDCLTVLDFIGQAHKNYRFDIRFRALLDDPTRDVEQEVQSGFAHLPAGCHVQLERVAQKHVLDNIGRAVTQSRSTLIGELRELADILGRTPALPEFLERNCLTLDDIYRRDICWSRLCVMANLRPDWADPDEARLTKGLRRLQHISSLRQIRALDAALAAAPESGLADMDEQTERLLLMSHFGLWGRNYAPVSLAASIQRIAANPVMRDELRDMLALRLDEVEFEPRPLSLPFACPLELHGAYTRDELLAGLGHWTLQAQPAMREGALHLRELKADAFLFTLHKTERHYSPTTMYRDYAISDTLIHWQSQSTTSVDSPTGQRYLTHRQTGHTILLFCREYKQSSTGLSNPYYFLGPADYVSHEGSRPISITWRLHRPLPAKLYRRMARLAVG